MYVSVSMFHDRGYCYLHIFVSLLHGLPLLEYSCTLVIRIHPSIWHDCSHITIIYMTPLLPGYVENW